MSVCVCARVCVYTLVYMCVIFFMSFCMCYCQSIFLCERDGRREMRERNRLTTDRYRTQEREGKK